ncbi:MAG: hypothetical protein AABZ60_24980 [Planctomycetota bacterium]
MKQESRVFIENKKIQYRIKNLSRTHCEEAKKLFIEEILEKIPKNSTQTFLISKGLEIQETALFLEDLQEILLLNLQELFLELKILDSTSKSA